MEDALAVKKTFFLYLAYNAPHFPLEAPDEITAEYEVNFEDAEWLATWGSGWDNMRQKTVRQKELGVVPQQQQLPIVNSFHNQSVMPGLQTGTTLIQLPAWNDLPDDVKKETLFRRSIYNAQITSMDDNIGRIVRTLKAKAYENTLILFVSDNGCSGEMGVFGTHFRRIYDYTAGKFEKGNLFLVGKRNGRMGRQGQLGGVGYQKDNYDSWKKFGLATSQGQGWASYSNTPFRKFKSLFMKRE